MSPSITRHCLKPPRHDTFINPSKFEAVPWRVTASQEVTPVNMGIQSHGDYGNDTILCGLPSLNRLTSSKSQTLVGQHRVCVERNPASWNRILDTENFSQARNFKFGRELGHLSCIRYLIPHVILSRSPSTSPFDWFRASSG